MEVDPGPGACSARAVARPRPGRAQAPWQAPRALGRRFRSEVRIKKDGCPER